MDIKDSLSFVFCVSDAYATYIRVTIKSIIENHKNYKVKIYVLSNFISCKNRKLLEESVAGSNAIIHIHIVDDTSLKGLKETWSIFAWYRLLVPECIPSDVHRILYLDADTIVCGDVSELFKINMDGYSIAACIDPESFNDDTFTRCHYNKEKKYVCAGVLLMNLDVWRDSQLGKDMIAFGFDNNDWIKLPDQDVINVLCQDEKLILPLKYGIMDYFLKEDRFYKEPYRAQLIECLENPAIVHFAGQNPWKRELATAVMQDEWDKYNEMLKHPVQKRYVTKGWNLVKLLVWNTLHPNQHVHMMTKEDIFKRLEKTK